MDSSDMEMDTAQKSPAPEMEAGETSMSRQMDNAWSLISRARQLIAEGNPTLALQAVLSAIKSEGGDHAVLRAMGRAREMYKQRAQSDADAAELASLLAQCALSTDSNGSNSNFAPMGEPSEMLGNPDAILAESGRKQIIIDAFADGSSFICLKCGGLISGARKDEHLANWCQ